MISKLNEVQNIKDNEDKLSLAKQVLSLLNNDISNLRKACKRTNENVIKDHLDLPYQNGKILGK